MEIKNDLSTITPHLAKVGEQNKDADTTKRADKKQREYQVQLSERSKELKDAYNKALEIARQTPEVREAKVAKLKEQIENGTYKADAGNIADGMLREAIREHLATSL